MPNESSSLLRSCSHYHCQLGLLMDCISQKAHTHANPGICCDLHSARALCVQSRRHINVIHQDRRAWPVTPPCSDQWGHLWIAVPRLFKGRGERYNVKMVFQKTPTLSFWKLTCFITLHSTTKLRFFVFLSSIKINAEVSRIPWGKEVLSFKSALVIPPPHFISISACYVFCY